MLHSDFRAKNKQFHKGLAILSEFVIVFHSYITMAELKTPRKIHRTARKIGKIKIKEWSVYLTSVTCSFNRKKISRKIVYV